MNKNNKKAWFSVKYVVGWYDKESNEILGYEEMVNVVKSVDFISAEKKMKNKIKKYCKDDGSNKLYKLESVIDIFELFDDNIEEFTEIYSSITETNLGAGEFLKRYYDI
jgi:hypothetical protein